MKTSIDWVFLSPLLYLAVLRSVPKVRSQAPEQFVTIKEKWVAKWQS